MALVERRLLYRDADISVGARLVAVMKGPACLCIVTAIERLHCIYTYTYTPLTHTHTPHSPTHPHSPGWQARASSSARSPSPVHTTQGELDEDLHSNCGAPQASNQTQPQDKEC